MKIAICQLNTVWECKKENLDKIERILFDIKQFDSDVELGIFPEFFTTGFSFNPELPEQMSGFSVSRLVEISKATGMALIGSIPIMDKGVYYNRQMLIDGSDIQYYDKRHIFRYGGEDRLFKQGEKRVIFKFKEYRILPQVCYDLRFPVWSRVVNNDYDLVIWSANWPLSRESVIEPLVRARAIENLAYAIFVNRTGSEPQINYAGKSIGVDFKGEIITKFGEKEEYKIIDISLERLNDFREKFRVWEDSDKFNLQK